MNGQGWKDRSQGEGFSLTPEESWYGVHLTEDELQFRPVARVWAGGILVAGSMLVVAGGIWLTDQRYLFPIPLAIAVYAMLGLRTRVRATAATLLVRNRFRRVEIEISEISGFAAVDSGGFFWAVLHMGLRGHPPLVGVAREWKPEVVAQLTSRRWRVRTRGKSPKRPSLRSGWQLSSDG